MKYDLIIVGDGIVGLSSALFAAREGKRVLVVDAYGVANAFGASGDESRLFRISYFENPSYVPLLIDAREQWKSLDPVLYVECGIAYAGPKESELIAETLNSAITHGLEHELFGYAEARQRFPQFELSEDFWVLFEPKAGYVRSGLASATMARLCLEWGVEFRCERAMNIVTGSVVTTNDTYFSDQILVAAGYRSSELLPELKPFLTADEYTTIWFATDGSVDWSTAHGFGVMDAGGNMLYGFPEGVGIPGVKVGAHIVPGDEPNRDALERLSHLYLNGLNQSVMAVKTCVYDQSPDGHFMIGEVREGVFTACGFSGHGFKFGSVIGQLVNQAMTTGLPSSYSFLDVSRYLGATETA